MVTLCSDRLTTGTLDTTRLQATAKGPSFTEKFMRRRQRRLGGLQGDEMQMRTYGAVREEKAVWS